MRKLPGARPALTHSPPTAARPPQGLPQPSYPEPLQETGPDLSPSSQGA